MTRDLEETLSELGPGFREVVGRLQAAYEPLDLSSERTPARVIRGASFGGAGRTIGWSFGYLIAASLLAFLGFSVFFREPVSVTANEYTLAGLRDEAAVRELIRTQNPDGSWKNDFLTRQNSAALRLSSAPEARIAYKKAVRNLRTRGLL